MARHVNGLDMTMYHNAIRQLTDVSDQFMEAEILNELLFCLIYQNLVASASIVWILFCLRPSQPNNAILESSLIYNNYYFVYNMIVLFDRIEATLYTLNVAHFFVW